MKNEKQVTRKNFLGWSLALSAVLAAPSLLFRKKKAQPKTTGTTAKMLTEDGRLVEVDLSQIPTSGKRIGEEEIHHWVKGKTTL